MPSALKPRVEPWQNARSDPKNLASLPQVCQAARSAAADILDPLCPGDLEMRDTPVLQIVAMSTDFVTGHLYLCGGFEGTSRSEVTPRFRCFAFQSCPAKVPPGALALSSVERLDPHAGC